MPKIIKPSGEEEFTYEKQTSFSEQSPVVAEANKLGQELKSIPLESVGDEYPTENAMDRVTREPFQLGGMIESSDVPSVASSGATKSPYGIAPFLPSYKKGGKVK